MTHRVGMLAAAILLASCGASSARSPAPRTAHCGPAGAPTLAAGNLARVYVVNGTAYGCSVVHAAKRYPLGQRATCLGTPRVGPVAVAGALAAYGLERCGVDTGLAQVVVRRLTDGKQLWNFMATTNPLGPESYQSVDSLALKSDGAVAWIGVASSIVRRGRDIEVHKAEQHVQVLLDSGPAIDPTSLRLRRSVLTWKRANRARRAALH